MTLKKLVMRRYPEVKPLEALLIADAIKHGDWEDFHHSRKDRIVFTIASLFMRMY